MIYYNTTSKYDGFNIKKKSIDLVRRTYIRHEMQLPRR